MQIVEKPWGRELWIAHTDRYALKIIEFRQGARSSLMGEKIVVFGAGATGRGHVGLLAWQAGAELVFVERRAELVETVPPRSTASPVKT